MLSRPFIVLAVATFAASMGIGMVAPVLPVHAESLGASGPLVALTFAAFAITQVFISPFAGRIADRYGRKPFIVAGAGTYIAASLGWVLIDDIYAVIAFRALTGVGSALIFSLASAYIGDLTPPGQEGRWMGMFGVFDFLGFGVGPIVSGVVRDTWGFDAVFLSMTVLMSSSLVTIALLLPSRVRRAGISAAQAAAEDAAGPPPQPPWSVVLGHPVVQGLFGAAIGHSIAFGAAFSFLAIYLEREIMATATMVGFVLAGQEMLGGLLQPVFGRVADRSSRRVMVAVGVTLMVAGYITVALSTTYIVIWFAFVAGAGLGAAIQGVAQRAVQVSVGRELGMATVMSLASTGFAAGVLIGSLAGGVVNDAIGTEAVFIFAAAALLAGALVFIWRTAGQPAAAPRRLEPPPIADAAAS
jgi:DHA1 family multidrug resistance protein-like MFS transporter